MRVAVLADIHAILPPLEAVLAELDREPVDAILVAGDIISGGPHPNEVLAALADRKALMVMGNHEERVLAFAKGGGPPDATGSRWAFTRWTARHLSAESRSLLESLPDERWVAFPGCDPIHLMHGAPWNLLEGQYFAGGQLIERALAESGAPLLTTAHSHYQWQAAGQDGRQQALNPGAVGPSADGTPGARYARMTWESGRWQPDLRTVVYDTSPIRPAYEASGFLAEGGALARGWMETTICGEDIIRYFFLHYTAVLRKRGLSPGEAIPDALWLEIEASFDWDGPFPHLNPSEPSGIVEGRVSTRRQNV